MRHTHGTLREADGDGVGLGVGLGVAAEHVTSSRAVRVGVRARVHVCVILRGSVGGVGLGVGIAVAAETFDVNVDGCRVCLASVAKGH